MIVKEIQVLSNSNLSTAATPSGVFTGETYSADGLQLYVLMVRVVGTPGGTSPTLTFAVQQSNDQVTWTQVGAALAAITAAGVQVTPYATGTAQGAITQTFVRVVATLGGTNPVFTGVYADLVGQIV